MSHIFTKDEDLQTASTHIDILRTKGSNKESIFDILEQIIPVNEEYQVTPEIDDTGYLAYFSGYDKKIQADTSLFLSWHLFFIPFFYSFDDRQNSIQKNANNLLYFPYYYLALFLKTSYNYE
jgi:hypothetical protein